MNPAISMACDAVLGSGSENFGTITGNVTFQNGSANSGTVTGNATFQGNAENKAGAFVQGNATFEVTATNSGAVTGTTTIVDTLFDAWFDLRTAPLPNGHTALQQYTGPGPKNEKWFFYQQGPFETKGDGLDSQYNYGGWLSSNTGVNSFTTFGGNPVDAEATHYGQWAYNSTPYGNEEDALAAEAAAQEAAYGAWLAFNTGVNQYSGAGSHNGQWAYNSTEYSSEADALAAETAAQEALYQAWLSTNLGVNQYSGPGARNGQWAYNVWEYASYQAAFDASLAG